MVQKPTIKSVMATVVGNHRVTEVGSEYDTHHIVLDFENTPFPVLEGQSIGVDSSGMLMRMVKSTILVKYSIAQPKKWRASWLQ
jgi:benzoyl-CoA 2,3-dioxygenase component A